MPFSCKLGEESCSNNNRKKNRTMRATSPTSFFRSPRATKSRDIERSNNDVERTTRTVYVADNPAKVGSPRRSIKTRPLEGHPSPAPSPSQCRIRRQSCDQFSFSAPVEVGPPPTAPKTAGIHAPVASNLRSIRDYLSRNGRPGAGSCTTPGSSPMAARSMEGAALWNAHRDSPDDPRTVSAFSKVSHKLVRQFWTRCSCPAQKFQGFRKCQTPDLCPNTTPTREPHFVEEQTYVGHSPPSCKEACDQEVYNQGHVAKRCQYLEAEIEYLRDREAELQSRLCLAQEENIRLASKTRALEESHREAVNARERALEECAEHERSFNRLQAAYAQKSMDLKEAKVLLEQERRHWMESMHRVQEELEKEQQRCAMYKANNVRPSAFTYTTDTDISLNDFFEDGSTPSCSDYQAGNLSSSVNNSPGISPRTLEDLAVENKRLKEENKKLKEECEDLANCRKKYEQRHNLDMLKQEGNKAFQEGKYEEALECYAAAFDAVGEDGRMQAVLYCNRAAALFNLERFLEAIVSCCCALECDDSYLRAYQRRASAYEAVGDLSSAVQDVTHIINSGNNSSVTRDARIHLTELHRKLKRTKSIDAYKILSLSIAASGAEIKSQYRKLALQFHPDKAQNRAGTSEVFKLISQAHAILTDEVKRSRYDAAIQRVNRTSPANKY